jgi:DNA-binding CsgD family transcriptional regulator
MDHPRSRRKRLTPTSKCSSRLPVGFPGQLLALCSAKDFDRFVNAAFRLLQATVACDWVSVLYPSVGTRMLMERDSRGRTYDAAFTRRHHELTPAVRLATATPGTKILPTRTGLTLSDDELRRTDYYREVMAVQGWRHAVALCFWNDPPGGFPVLVFGVQRKEGRVDFSDADLEALQIVHGFMEPVVLRFYERAMARALSDALATLVRHPGPGVVVNSAMQIVSANRAALTLFRKKRGLRAAALEQCRRMNEERLNVLHADSIGGGRRHRDSWAVDDSAGSILITMFGHDAKGLSNPSFLVEIDAAAEKRDEGALLTAVMGLDGLTAAERDVVLALGGGHSNQEIADRLEKSVPAVKFLLHRIYTKTGISNRAALVAALQALQDRRAKRGSCRKRYPTRAVAFRALPKC